jgi:hypothetical protein
MQPWSTQHSPLTTPRQCKQYVYHNRDQTTSPMHYASIHTSSWMELTIITPDMWNSGVQTGCSINSPANIKQDAAVFFTAVPL